MQVAKHQQPDLHHTLTVFAGAFLLFQIQPLFAKFILPWFGGSQAVWTTCMLFFQLFLLAGYAYAHAIVRFLPVRSQAVLHGILLAAALAFLPITPDPDWAPRPGQDPTWRILMILTRYLGMPYLLLAATSPLIQRWFSLSHPKSSPYRLYALSNAGSLLALLTYPFLLEPATTRQTQGRLWAWSFVAFALLCGGNAWRIWRSNPQEREPESREDDRAPARGKPAAPTTTVRTLWFLLPACSSILLLAITNKLCQDVMSIPFLWILPLSIYLVTFIWCFERPGHYSRSVYTLLLIPLAAMLCDVLLRENRLRLQWQAIVYCGTLFVACMLCHGEVSRLRPAPRFLTSFYLRIAAGGAVGGALVAIVAPLVLRTYAELSLGICLLAGLVAFVHARDRTALRVGRHRWLLWPVLAVGVAVLASVFLIQGRRKSSDVVYTSRSFYGVLRVLELGRGTPYRAYKLRHGDTNHGLQMVEPDKVGIPTTYYAEESGVGVALSNMVRPGGRNIGVVGLGTGTIAVYGRPGDTIRFYEINPKVRQLAETWFSFLKNSKAHVEVVLGDGRLSLENEQGRRYDLLAIDAFSSDAIPVHLLTREAFAIYLDRLQPNGVIAVHISNRHVNLYPVVEAAATSLGLPMVCIDWRVRPMAAWDEPSRWILLSRDRQFLTSEPIRRAATGRPSHTPDPVLWTDDYASLFRVINR
jgi:spermidine synthase